MFRFLKNVSPACNENAIPHGKAPAVLKQYIDTIPDFLCAVKELTDCCSLQHFVSIIARLSWP